MQAKRIAEYVRIDYRRSHVAGYWEVVRIVNGVVVEVLGNRKLQSEARELAQEVRERIL